jgi:hypothetical protein
MYFTDDSCQGLVSFDRYLVDVLVTHALVRC